MKKIFTSILAFSLFLCLTACGKTKTKSTNNITANKDYENCTITYAAWDLGSTDSETPSMERLMLKEFEKKYPGIKVEVMERPKDPVSGNNQNWNEFLAAKASVNTLPDVFQVDSIPYIVTNGWAIDCSKYTEKDSEYQSMSSDVKNAATYSGHVMALPQSIFYMGYLINESLYEKSNLDAPTVTTTYTELLNLTKQAANHTSPTGNGVVGLMGIEHLIHYMPAQNNENFGWWTYDGKKFNLDSEEFVNAINEYRKLRTDQTFVFEALEDEAKKEGSEIVLEDIFGTKDYINEEKILSRFVYSYEFGNIQAAINSNKLKDNYAFIGTPVFNGVKRVPIVLDFLCVSSQSKHPYESYLLAKWMGFGDDGYQRRLELGEEYASQNIAYVDSPSLTGKKEHLDKFFEIYTAFSDLRSIIEKGDYIVEPVKYLPGYNEARYKGTYDAENNMFQIIDSIMKGTVQITDIKTELNNRANALMNSAANAMNESLNKLK